MTWTSMINRGELYNPSDDIFSQLTVMREEFKCIHKESLRVGKDCMKTVAPEMQCPVTDVPVDIILFIAKISVFFRKRYLNKNIEIYERKKKAGRGMSR